MQPSSGATDETLARELGDVLSFMHLLWAIDHRLQSVSKRMSASIGVTGPQRLVIRIIGRYGRISPGKLASVLQLDPSSLTGILQRLADARFIVRRVDPKDARRAVLELSARGRRMDAQRAGTVEAAISSALQAVPGGMVRAAEDVLRQIVSELDLRWGDSATESKKPGRSPRTVTAHGARRGNPAARSRVARHRSR